MRRVALVGLVAFVATSVCTVGFNTFASADAFSGWVYRATTGPYFPGWNSDDCLQGVQRSFGAAESDTLSTVSPGRCSGQLANMQSGWQGTNAYGYKNGSYCGSTGWGFNSATTYESGVGARLCFGSGNYHALAWGEWWTDVNGTYRYSFPGNQASPTIYVYK